MSTQNYSKHSFHLVSPAVDESSWEAFSDLYPMDTERENSSNLYLGVVNANNQAVAAMTVVNTIEGYKIQWLYVEPDERRKGAATTLLKGFLDFVNYTADFKEVEVDFGLSDSGVFEFFDSIHCFDIEEIADEYRITPEDILSNRLLCEMAKKNANVVPFAYINNYEKGLLSQKLDGTGLLDVLDLRWQDKLLSDISFVKRENDDITGCILFLPVSTNEVELTLLYSENQSVTVMLLTAACKAFAEKYPTFTIRTTPVNNDSTRLVKKIFPDIDGSGKKYIASWNYADIEIEKRG